MTNTGRLWILGAPDPEMEAIEALLLECGERVAHALAGGERVHPGSAYSATAHRYAVDCAAAGGRETWYLVECLVPVPDAATSEVIDHHRPGDPGYGRPPAEFLSASSLGQVISELERLGLLPSHWRKLTWAPGANYADYTYALAACSAAQRAEPTWVIGARRQIPRDLVLIAAADHCLGAAYRGECLGVDPDELMRWRAESRARFQGRSIEQVLADIEQAKDRVLAAPKLELTSVVVRDMRTDSPSSDARGAAVPELPEAALRLGESYVAGPLITPDGRHKIVCSGTPEVVRAFAAWAPKQGLTDCYGDTMRGFAGAYLAQAERRMTEDERRET